MKDNIIRLEKRSLEEQIFNLTTKVSLLELYISEIRSAEKTILHICLTSALISSIAVLIAVWKSL